MRIQACILPVHLRMHFKLNFYLYLTFSYEIRNQDVTKILRHGSHTRSVKRRRASWKASNNNLQAINSTDHATKHKFTQIQDKLERQKKLSLCQQFYYYFNNNFFNTISFKKINGKQDWKSRKKRSNDDSHSPLKIDEKKRVLRSCAFAIALCN